jgi:hypothetical protein
MCNLIIVSEAKVYIIAISTNGHTSPVGKALKKSDCNHGNFPIPKHLHRQIYAFYGREKIQAEKSQGQYNVSLVSHTRLNMQGISYLFTAYPIKTASKTGICIFRLRLPDLKMVYITDN